MRDSAVRVKTTSFSARCVAVLPPLVATARSIMRSSCEARPFSDRVERGVDLRAA